MLLQTHVECDRFLVVDGRLCRCHLCCAWALQLCWWLCACEALLDFCRDTWWVAFGALRGLRGSCPVSLVACLPVAMGRLGCFLGGWPGCFPVVSLLACLGSGGAPACLRGSAVLFFQGFLLWWCPAFLEPHCPDQIYSQPSLAPPSPVRPVFAWLFSRRAVSQLGLGSF